MKPLTCFGGWCSSDFSDSNLQYLIMTWFDYITSFVKMFAAEEQLAPRWFSTLDGVSTRRVSSPSQLPHQLQSVLFLCRRGVWVHIPLSAVTRCTPLPQHPAGCLATLSVHGNAANKRPLSSSACTPQLGLNWGNQERRGAGRINGGGGGTSLSRLEVEEQIWLMPKISARKPADLDLRDGERVRTGAQRWQAVEQMSSESCWNTRTSLLLTHSSLEFSL